ncbi:CAP domain-containing protein [Nocardioides sp. SYSU DS0651]|uniref:CAP domain-containing protein n=1 Tax=Nocardioides sp. SYSU DS0651 TaxID=3415955 RepID=UPI003F4C95EB
MRRIIGLLPLVVLGLVVGMGTGPVDAAPAPAAPARTLSAPGAMDLLPARLLVQRAYEDRVLVLTNRKRRARGCAPLRANWTLRKAARSHSVTMARHNEMSHRLPGEPRFSVRITRAGYRDWRIVAENVARGFSSPAAVVKAWMRSPGHRANILNCRLRDLGVGVVLARGQLWWTQNFGRR